MISDLDLSLSGVETRVKINWEDFLQNAFVKDIGNLQTQESRVIVGIAGCGGSGKTLLSTLLHRAFPNSQKLSIDAYHLQNQRLIDLGIKDVKGIEPTLDRARFFSDVRRCKSCNEVFLPDYDRALHEPVENRTHLQKDHNILFLEGLYVIHWPEIRELLDYCIFLDCDQRIAKDRIVNRKVQGGRAHEDCIAHYHRVDEPTYHLLNTTKHHADILIHSLENDIICYDDGSGYSCIIQ